MVSAITCKIWLRLDYRPLFSAWFFNTELWYFHPRRPFLEPGIWIWVPAGLGTFFGQKWGPEKHDFVEEMVPHEVLWGSVRGDWIVWCPGGLWAGPFPPKPCQKIILQGFPHFPKNPWAPLGPWWVPYWPFKGAIAYFATRSPGRRLALHLIYCSPNKVLASVNARRRH